MQTYKNNVVDLGQVRRSRNFAAAATAPLRASIQLTQMWANYAFGITNLMMRSADIGFRANVQLAEAFQNSFASYSIRMDADAFCEHLPISKEDLYKDASVVMGRVLMPGEDDNAPARSLSDYQELKLDVEKPGEKFSIYLGSRDGNGARYNFNFDGENVVLTSAYSVHDFNKKYKSLNDVVRETAKFTDTLLDFIHHIRHSAEQKMLLSQKKLPVRELGSRDHLTLVEI